MDTEIGSASGLDSIEGNLALWLDASNINGQGNSGLKNGDDIKTWFDMSGNERHASNEVIARMPHFKTYLVLIIAWGHIF